MPYGPVGSPKWYNAIGNGGDGLWPDSQFPQVEPGPLRDELIAHQTLARVVREGRGRRNMSVRALAREARVSRVTVEQLESGSGTVELRTAVKVLHAVDAMLAAMPKSLDSRQRAQLRRRAETEMERPADG